MRQVAVVLLLIGVLVVPASAMAAQEPIFEERFDGDLAGWTGKSGGAHSGVIVNDPIRTGNRVLTFSALGSAGDVFSAPISVQKKKTYRLKFDYLGQPGRGVPGDLGGIFGIAIDTPGNHRWLAGTQTGAGETDRLEDDGRWHTYTVEFVPGSRAWFSPSGASAEALDEISALRLMLEDNVGSHGSAGDAFFDNIKLTECRTCSTEDVRVDVRFHANNLPTAPPSDGGQCTGRRQRARITGTIMARVVDGFHQGGGDVVDTPHRSRCRVPVIQVAVDRVRLNIIRPGRILRATLFVHITQEGVHRPGQCQVGTTGRIIARFNDTDGAANGLRAHRLQIGPWSGTCEAHNHEINNNITSIPADAGSSTWVRVTIACPGPGFAPRNCRT